MIFRIIEVFLSIVLLVGFVFYGLQVLYYGMKQIFTNNHNKQVNTETKNERK